MTSRTPRPPPLYRLVNLDTVGSTNAEAKRLADGGGDEWTLVWARAQTAGRGRHGRIWESPEGNLYCSLLLRPACPPGQAAEIGFVAGLAIYDAIGSLVLPGLEAWCKWPNDVLLNDAKVAGVLLEVSGTDWLVLGVGINVAHYPDATDFPATSLREQGSPEVTVEDMLEAFCRHFLTWYNRWRDEGFAPIRARWLQRAMGLDEEISVRLSGETVSGVFAGLDDDGTLILERPDGDRRISAGDVFFT